MAAAIFAVYGREAGGRAARHKRQGSDVGLYQQYDVYTVIASFLSALRDEPGMLAVVLGCVDVGSSP